MTRNTEHRTLGRVDIWAMWLGGVVVGFCIGWFLAVWLVKGS